MAIRSEPNKSSERLGRLTKGTVFTGVPKGNWLNHNLGWTLIRTDEKMLLEEIQIDHRRVLAAFYSRFDTRKLKVVDKTVQKFKGKENKIWDQLTKKYLDAIEAQGYSNALSAAMIDSPVCAADLLFPMRLDAEQKKKKFQKRKTI